MPEPPARQAERMAVGYEATGRDDLWGRVAIVTGASSGIGAACAVELVRRGAQAVLTGRDPERLRAAAESTGFPDRCDVLALDLTDDGAPATLVDRCRQRFGGIDIVVHSAGIYVNERIEEASVATLDREWEINVRAPYALTVAAVPHLPRGASVVFISSVFGSIGLAGASAYCATKGAVEQLTKTLALELAPRGVRVNAVAPGFILTPLNESTLGAPTEARRAVETRTPAARIGDVAEVAPAVAYLVSDAASFVHGATLVIDGGWAAQ